MGCKSQVKVTYIFLVMFFIRLELLNSTRIYRPRREQPKIWAKSYVEVDSYESITIANQFDGNNKNYDKGFIIKNGSDYIISSEVAQIKFACEADYPITWRFSYPDQFAGVAKFSIKLRTERSSEFTDDLPEPKNTKFHAYLTIIRLGGFQSGYLSCQSTPTVHMQTQIYVYSEGENAIENARGSVKVNLTNSRVIAPVVLPCRPAHPMYTVSLAKEVVTSLNVTEWVQLNLNSSIRFDPKRGFLLNKKLPGIKGKYRCTLDGEEDEMYTTVEVVPGELTSLDFKVKSEFDPKVASLSITPSAISCCNGKHDFPTHGTAMDCGNEAECNLLKPVFMRDYMSGKNHVTILSSFYSRIKNNIPDCYMSYLNFYSPSKLLICEGTNIQVVGQYVAGFRTKSDDSEVIPAFIEQQLSFYDLSNTSHRFGIDEQIGFRLDIPSGFMTIGSPVYFAQGTRLSRRLHSIKPFYDSNYEMSVSLLPMYEVRRKDLVFEGEKVRITCISIQYYYAKGGWLQLNWKNGSRRIFEQADMYSYIGEKEKSLGSGYATAQEQLPYFTSVAVIDKVELDMDSIDCFVPVWNSVKWEKQTFKLNVKPSVLPTFDNPKDEIIHLSLNETRYTINCSVVSSEMGVPIHIEISWKKDGKKLVWGNGVAHQITSLNENVTVSSLYFRNVSHVMHGEYQCMAKNMKGTVVKSFIVIVGNGSSSNLTIIACSVLGIAILAVMIMAMAWWHWRLRAKLGGMSRR